MNLIISFSARTSGNCGDIAKFIQKDEDRIVYFNLSNSHSCSNCHYECFSDNCKYRDDDIYLLYASMKNYDKVFLIIPMYAGNPSSLYFIFNERSQDFFMHNSEEYEQIIDKLYIIGIFGSEKETPDFLPTLSKWFCHDKIESHVLGIERHTYGQKIEDSVLDVEAVRHKLVTFAG